MKSCLYNINKITIEEKILTEIKVFMQLEIIKEMCMRDYIMK